MDAELEKKITEHDVLIKEIPQLRDSIHKQDIVNERILNKMDSLTNSLEGVNLRLDKMDKNFEKEKENSQISWTATVKSAIVKALEVGVAVLIALALGGKNLF